MLYCAVNMFIEGSFSKPTFIKHSVQIGPFFWPWNVTMKCKFINSPTFHTMIDCSRAEQAKDTLLFIFNSSVLVIQRLRLLFRLNLRDTDKGAWCRWMHKHVLMVKPAVKAYHPVDTLQTLTRCFDTFQNFWELLFQSKIDHKGLSNEKDAYKTNIIK